jgi:flavin-dependent dehydrogenase
VESSEGTFEATFVIAADGVNSRISKIMGLRKNRKFKGTWRYYGCELEGELPVDPGSFIFILDKATNYSIVPTYDKNIFHIGMFTFDTGMNMKPVFDDFVNNDPVYSPWFKKIKIRETQTCVVNEFSPMPEPFKDNVLFIGDATWAREFSNMASLCCGFKSANAITTALLENRPNKDALGGYFEWWNENFFGPHGDSEFGTVDFQEFLSGDDIDYLASLIKKPFKRTLDFYTLFSEIGNTYAELFPVIQQERPDVMERMLKMRDEMGDAADIIRKKGFPNK